MIEGYATLVKGEGEAMSEQWKQIPGYEGLYEASSLGRIRSSPGKTTSNARYASRRWKSRVMKEKAIVSKNRKDARISLWKDGIQKDHLVSRLVASAWHGLPEESMTVNHINGDWSDNRPENLEWMTLTENIKDGFRNGFFDSICIKISLSGSDGVFQFRSMSEASRYLGRSIGYVSARIKNGYRTAVSSNGSVYQIMR